jgi:hypothetical protein
MSKRKNRSSSPNLPQATLDRARQQLSGQNPAQATEPVEETPVEVKAEAVAPAVSAAPKAAPRTASTPSRTRSSSKRTQSAQPKGARANMDTQVIKNRLLHPTRLVTEDQLRQEYGYVMHDLRTIAVIAIAMIVLMVVLAQVL